MDPARSRRHHGSFIRAVSAAGLGLVLSTGSAFAINAALEDDPATSGFQQLDDFITGLNTHSETLHIVAHHGRLFAGLGRWVQSDTNPDIGAQVIVKDSASDDWDVFDTFDYTVRVTGLRSVTVPSSANGGGGNVDVLLAQSHNLVSGNQEMTLVWALDGDSSFTGSYQLGGPEDTRAFYGRLEGSTYAFYAGVSDTGIYRGTWNAATQTINWSSTPELIIDSGTNVGNEGRVLAMAECNGALYAAVKRRIYRRNDGGTLVTDTDSVGDNNSRWVRVNVENIRGSAPSGWRGLTCVTQGSAPALLATYESSDGTVLTPVPYAGKMVRFGSLPTGDLSAKADWSATIEADIGDTIAAGLTAMGRTTANSAIGYAIAAYNEWQPYTYGGVLRHAAGVQWFWNGGCPSDRQCQTSSSDAAACFITRSPGTTPTFAFDCLQGTNMALVSKDADGVIEYREAFNAVRTIEPAPWDGDIFYYGGIDGNNIAHNGSAWIASFNLTP
ncbi:MAG: hypothetical protein HXY25_07380 [Alphaproteobacteria bacterium]|nr:hypothetical protein [Alphaproteobacteria bacterium]